MQENLFSSKKDDKFQLNHLGEKFCRICGWEVFSFEESCPTCGDFGLGKNFDQDKCLQQKLEYICLDLESSWGWK